MENTGNIYNDDVRQGDTAQAYETTTQEAQNSQAKISDSHKWASRIFTTVAILGWIVVAALLADAIFFNSRIMEWIMIGQ